MALVNPNIALSVQTPSAPNVLGMAATSENILASQQQRQALGQDMERAQYAQAIQKSRDALNFVRTPEDYVAWTQAQFQDPVLSGMLGQMGVTPEQSMERVQRELSQPGGFERLVAQSSASTAQLSDMMTGRVNALNRQREAAAGAARTAEQQAAVDAIISGQGGGTAPVTPSAQAFPVAPPVDNAVYAPGTPGAINQLYAQGASQQSPALNALTTAPSASADPRMAQLTALREAQIRGNTQAGRAADILESQIKAERDLFGGPDPSKRYINLGEQGVFDTVTQQVVEGTARKPKVGTPLPVVTAEGNVVYVPPEEAIGKTPGSQAPTAAERAKQEKTEKGKQAVDEVLTQIGDYYAELDKLRGVPSTERNVFSNVAAYTGAVMPFAGRATGSKEQQLRDQITQIRSALVREIKNATGMSAQELNSNVELQLALEAATDPTISIQANMETLRNLSTLYGSGKLATPQGQSAEGGSDIDALLEKYK